MNELQPYPSKMMQLAAQIEAFSQIAKRLYNSELKPVHVKSENDMFVIVAAANDLDVPLTTAMSQIFPIENKIYIGVHLATALAKSHPDCLYWYVIECNAQRCIIETHRRGAPAPERIEWTIEQAEAVTVEKKIWRNREIVGVEKSKLTDKLGWQNYAADYLHGRAVGRLARRVYPDRLFGLFVKEEYDGDESEQRMQAAPARVSLIPDANAQPRIVATAHATTRPVAEHKQIEHVPAPFALTPPEPDRDEAIIDAEPPKREAPAEPEQPKRKAPSLDDKAQRIGRMLSDYLPDGSTKSDLANALLRMTEYHRADVHARCVEANEDPDEGNALLRKLAAEVLNA